ncbi:MAG: RnfH family protein [Legionellaceae bacterium]|nr:RnfH family protein [Legionellaceae bacterium]
MMYVDVVYAPLSQKPIQRRVDYVKGLTVGSALEQSGLVDTHPEIAHFSVGVFSTVVSLDAQVKAGDRIEIYRPLLIDPKEKRRQRAR